MATHCRNNPLEPIYPEEEVAITAGPPETVLPDSVSVLPCAYPTVNGQYVAIDPGTRRIVRFPR